MSETPNYYFKKEVLGHSVRDTHTGRNLDLIDAAIKVNADNILIRDHVEGVDNFAGPGGVTITHTSIANYIPDVIPTANPGDVGAVWITDVTPTTFVVRNTGIGVSAFTWSVHKR